MLKYTIEKLKKLNHLYANNKHKGRHGVSDYEFKKKYSKEYTILLSNITTLKDKGFTKAFTPFKDVIDI